MSRPPSLPAGPFRFVGVVFGLVFAGIGLTVIGFLWTQSGFHEPPLFFKLFGSLIALTFIAVGSVLALTALRLRAPSTDLPSAPMPPDSPGPAAAYACPACGARLGPNADVSPRGDVKCGYCNRWFNIHGEARL